MVNSNFKIGAFWSAIVAVVIKSVSTNVHYVTTNSSDDVNSSNTLKHYTWTIPRSVSHFIHNYTYFIEERTTL